VPDLSLSTDIIVGYPGETDADFAETLSLLARVEYDNIYSFCYSPRPNTPALKLQQRDDVPLDVKNARLQTLQTLQSEITARRLARFVGRTIDVLVEGNSRNDSDNLCGRAPGNEVVNFAAPVRIARDKLVGALVPVVITSSGRYTLKGECALRAPIALPVLAS
jgi:tRNA-2-methylthio-N6-dimethylallyladenosine synthase